MENPYSCTRCQTDQTQAISVLIQAGTTLGTSKGVAVGLGTGGVGIGGFSSLSHEQTALALRFNPGSEPSARTPFLLSGMCLVLSEDPSFPTANPDAQPA
jgi:hypothetical protein